MQTLVERLRGWAGSRPGDLAFAFLADGETERDPLSFADLDRRARQVCATLAAADARGRPVLLLAPPGAEFVAGFCGCLYAGAIAVPVPVNLRNWGLERIAAIAADARPAAVLGVGHRPAVLDAALGDAPWLRLDELHDPAPGPDRLAEDPDQPAFLQYTSGSTAAPKGVVISHANLAANIGMIADGFDITRPGRFLTWLPVHHDMGLIGHLLSALYLGDPCRLAPPLSFLQRPERWLKAISRHRATFSGAPNFAYELCVRNRPRMDLEGVDLSSWTTAFCGAEPVRAPTLERFIETFAPFGLDPRAVRPCYGLAEATVFATAASRLQVLPEGVRPAGGALVGCGRTANDGRLVIADPDTLEPVAEGQVGEICLAGPHIGQGYWGRPEETAEIFQAPVDGPGGPRPMLRTGDLGLVWRGELYVAGRRKDVIVHRGETIQAEDMEQAIARRLPMAGSAAAFSIDTGQAEEVVVVQEVLREHLRSLDAGAVTLEALKGAAEVFGVRLYDLVLVRPGAIPRTTSGKVRRRACRELYLSGGLKGLADGLHPSLGRAQAEAIG